MSLGTGNSESDEQGNRSSIHTGSDTPSVTPLPRAVLKAPSAAPKKLGTIRIPQALGKHDRVQRSVTSPSQQPPTPTPPRGFDAQVAEQAVMHETVAPTPGKPEPVAAVFEPPVEVPVAAGPESLVEAPVMAVPVAPLPEATVVEPPVEVPRVPQSPKPSPAPQHPLVHQVAQPEEQLASTAVALSPQGSSGLALPQQAERIQAPVLVPYDPSIVMASHSPMAPAPPQTSLWSLAQLVAVMVVMGMVAMCGAIVGGMYGSTKAPKYGARTELFYALNNSVPDGFLREDRRVLTQIVTIQSDAVTAPVAETFGVTQKAITKALSVEVVDMSEVIRIDVADKDPQRALAINKAVLAQYRSVLDTVRQDSELTDLFQRRDQITTKLDELEPNTKDRQLTEIRIIELQSREETLSRDIDFNTSRIRELAALSDGSLANSPTVADTSSASAQIASAEAEIARLSSEKASIVTQRQQLQATISQYSGTEDDFLAVNARAQDSNLAGQQASIDQQISTLNSRINSLLTVVEQARSSNRNNTDVIGIQSQLDVARLELATLEEELLKVRTEKIKLEQQSQTDPAVQREINALNAELQGVETKIGELNLVETAPDPIRIMQEPFIMDKPVNNPMILFAALGIIAAIPFALLAGYAVRRQQLRKIS